MVLVGLALILIIGLMLIRGSSTPENEGPDPTGMRVSAPQRF
jgi:hypothetical protein